MQPQVHYGPDFKGDPLREEASGIIIFLSYTSSTPARPRMSFL
jgi:hypothetical protein